MKLADQRWQVRWATMLCGWAAQLVGGLPVIIVCRTPEQVAALQLFAEKTGIDFVEPYA